MTRYILSTFYLDKNNSDSQHSLEIFDSGKHMKENILASIRAWFDGNVDIDKLLNIAREKVETLDKLMELSDIFLRVGAGDLVLYERDDKITVSFFTDQVIVYTDKDGQDSLYLKWVVV